MNANELADKLLDNLTMEYDCDDYMELAATMLRQQQAEIEALKAHPVKDKPHPKCDEACMYLCRMRELTDEEIDDIGREHLTDGDGAIEFARAILRKAQEK